MLLHIPSETRKRLQKLVAENLRHRQAATHEFLVGCQALRELRLAEFLHLQGVRDLAAGTPPHIQTPEYYTQNELYGRSDHFLGSILEPWGCTWTLECIDLEGYPIVEQEAMVAWLDRLVWMPHLTKLAISVHQARLMLQVCRRGIPSVSSTDKVQLQHVWQLRLSMTRVTRTPQDNSFAPVHWSEGTLNESELRELLEMMPRIHSLRYIGKAYPLFHDATRWLETHRPHLQLLHVLQ
ncbi:hypothetical protein BGZ73_002667 [Actinomortierella ambigua]|nr:hypothetical protein BGZ73_002667 [Actinomortierella ambigua]